MKKMNKRGFTLIELLAIIVILAIIAVITVPIILNIIENARVGAARSSALGYADAIKLAYVESQYNQNSASSATGIPVTATIGNSATTLYVHKEGSTVNCSGVEILSDGTLHINSCTVGKYTFGDYRNGKFNTDNN